MWELFLLVTQWLGMIFSLWTVVKGTMKTVKIARGANAVNVQGKAIRMSVVVAKMTARVEVAKVKVVLGIATVLIGIARDQVAEVRNARGVTAKAGKAVVTTVVPMVVVFGTIALAKVVATGEVARVKTAWAAAKSMPSLVRATQLRMNLPS